jgi:hypothetical protein
MILEPSFLDHWKVQLLVRRTGEPTAPFVLLRLWGHCQVTRKSRLAVSAEGLACICKWEGNPDVLVSLLLELRFLEQENGVYVVHEFDQHNAKLVSNWNNGSKGGRPSKRKPKLDFAETRTL